MGLICRKCAAPAQDVRHEWRNEAVAFIYSHGDQSEHRIDLKAVDAQAAYDEDEAARRAQ